MRYDIYHDESKEAGYWHGILLVPRTTRGVLLERLASIRENARYRHPVTLKRLRNTTGPRGNCLRGWITLGVAALMQNLKGKSAHYFSGIRRQSSMFEKLDHPIRARFVLFRVRGGHQDLMLQHDHGARVETTFRMALKGGLHLFVDEGTQLEVESLHFDGHEHYGRHLDKARIIHRLGELRDGVRIGGAATLWDGSSDHRREDSQAYDDCQLLQLTDLLVGGFRTVLGLSTNPTQAKMAEPLLELAQKWHQGPARMRNSRWHKGFCISECFLKDGEWQFSNLKPERASLQLPMWRQERD